jgi:NADPH:quinone reductase-like Zn-dependent oxidoreductase
MATMTMTETMNAVCIHDFGGPEVVRYESMLRPEPGPGHVLVRVRAAGVNPVDWKIREGLLGTSPLPQVLGSDISGTVEALGSGVSEFKVGDPVFGSVTDNSGAYAEFAVSAVAQLAHRPSALDDVHAAALPIASLTAWQALFDKAELGVGQRVLIHAAAGGVGGFAVQFAKWKEAYVIGTASSPNEKYVRELGADEFIDYKAAKFEEKVKNVDVVLDTLGKDTQERSWKVLKRGGILVSLVQPPSNEAAAAHGVRGVFMRCDHNRGDQLAKIAKLVVNGQVKVNVETILPLQEARKALELSQHGHVRGKIVLTVG